MDTPQTKTASLPSLKRRLARCRGGLKFTGYRPTDLHDEISSLRRDIARLKRPSKARVIRLKHKAAALAALKRRLDLCRCGLEFTSYRPTDLQDEIAELRREIARRKRSKKGRAPGRKL